MDQVKLYQGIQGFVVVVSTSTSVVGASVEGETEASVMEESVSTSVDGSAVDENC